MKYETSDIFSRIRFFHLELLEKVTFFRYKNSYIEIGKYIKFSSDLNFFILKNVKNLHFLIFNLFIYKNEKNNIYTFRFRNMIKITFSSD